MGPKKKKKMSTDETACQCILHFEECQDSNKVAMNELMFEKIKNIAQRRQAQPPDSEARFDGICKNIPDTFDSSTGYHR